MQRASRSTTSSSRLAMLKVLGTVRPRSLVIAAAAINTALELGLSKDLVITSGNDGQHMTGSKHFTGAALDVRTKTLTRSERERFVTAVRRRLGPDYDVVLEDVGDGQRTSAHRTRSHQVSQTRTRRFQHRASLMARWLGAADRVKPTTKKLRMAKAGLYKGAGRGSCSS